MKNVLFIFVCLFIFSANAELKFRSEFENKNLFSGQGHRLHTK